MQLHCNDILWQKNKKNQWHVLAHLPHSCNVSWKVALSSSATLKLLQEVIVSMPQLWGNESDSFNFTSQVIFHLSKEGECCETALTFSVQNIAYAPLYFARCLVWPFLMFYLIKWGKKKKMLTKTHLNLFLYLFFFFSLSLLCRVVPLTSGAKLWFWVFCVGWNGSTGFTAFWKKKKKHISKLSSQTCNQL